MLIIFGDLWIFLGKDAELDVYAQATSSCITIPNIYLYDWSNHKNTVYQRCYDQTAKILPDY